jgi:ribosomal protein S4E
MADDINKKSFSRMVETFVRTHRGCQYMDAIVELCEKNEIDLRDSKKLISKEIVEHLEFEARALNMLQGGNTSYTLPV